MLGIVWRDHVASAGPVDQGPAVVGLESVVVGAEAVEVVEGRFVRLGPRDTVIDLGMSPGLVAPGSAARRLGPQQSNLLRRRWSATEMDDPGDLVASGEDEVQDRVAQRVASHLDGDGSEPGQLAQLVGSHRAPDEGIEIDTQQRQVLGLGRWAPS
jgi:hypothetical protein